MTRHDYSAAIYNACWWVRNTSRRSAQRHQAILRLGVTVRQAFADCDAYEALLSALLDGLDPKEPPRPF